MLRKRKLLIFKAAAVLSVVPALIYAHSAGPDAGYSGVPNEGGNCTSCHRGTNNLNNPSFGGSVKVTFAGTQTYTPGVSQHLVVTVADASQKKWGFQLTARLSSNSATQAGNFTPGSDGFTQLACDSADLDPAKQSIGASSCAANQPLQYIEHTLAAYNATQSSFQFDWTPPSTDVGSIDIYVAGNAANGNGDPTGDHIYTAKYTLTPAAAGGNAPTITGVVNGAGFQNSIQSGSWVTITGTFPGVSTGTWTDDDFAKNNGTAPTSLSGTSVSINGKPAFVYYVSPTQINVQAPTDSAVGSVNVQVATAAGTSNNFSATLQANSPACFLWTGKYVVATRPDFSLVAKPGLFSGLTTTPAKPGDVIILWGTGFGATNPAVPAGQKVTGAPVAENPTITIGGVQAQVLGTVLSPGFLGLYQIAITVPPTVQTGGDVPVMATSSGVAAPGNAFLTIAGN